MSEQPDHETLDLIEMRRQLTALRSKHSDNLLIASLLNRFFVKVAFLVKPTDLAQTSGLKDFLRDRPFGRQRLSAGLNRPGFAGGSNS
ncbi:hypothetical protein QCM80_46260 [Bradyrhizobium sp. SSUT112]|uniref:hypothetical protein n=1 Tax=Bradyrhizobium sp. SSUT112 TaxID=3040604 RepID=UPI00244BC373|nr:hypothetical protein [Bradyrhizobium sp. SSUT112]MDH2357838.1 hypothetical protein [Bradyrhizobium sp. SSUT112]